MKVVKFWSLKKKKRKWTLKALHKGLIVALVFALNIILIIISQISKAIPLTMIQSIENHSFSFRLSLLGMLIHLKNLELQIVKESVSFSNYRVFVA